VATSRARASDIKLIVSATIAVVLAGLFVAGGILVATRGGGSVVCGSLNLGSATDVRQKLDDGGAYFQTGGADCGFWLALADGNIVAYKVSQPPDGCPLKLLRDHWGCGSRTLQPADLAQYPVSIQTIGQTDSVFIDLIPPGLEVTTTTFH
jgi:hypothetical protein